MLDYLKPQMTFLCYQTKESRESKSCRTCRTKCSRLCLLECATKWAWLTKGWTKSSKGRFLPKQSWTENSVYNKRGEREETKGEILNFIHSFIPKQVHNDASYRLQVTTTTQLPTIQSNNYPPPPPLTHHHSHTTEIHTYTKENTSKYGNKYTEIQIKASYDVPITRARTKSSVPNTVHAPMKLPQR